MSINRSMYIGLTGMNANTQAINIIGDNIANMNTIGFKSSRSVFQEMLGQSLMGAGGGHMGGGVST
ncbi:MAG: flagellar hook protein FlgE, partial [Myxococcota bacterium]